MEVNNKDNFIRGLKDFYFRVFEDFFPDITRVEFDKEFNKSIKIGKE